MEQPPYAITVPAGMEKKVKPKIVNMDGSDDPFYRYKMPQVIAFVLGKGKMIKTMIANADQVAVSLKRPPSYLVHYIGYQLSAQCKYEAKKPAGENAQVSGDISGEKLSELTESFIREWITCPKCELPECDLEIKKKEVSIKLVCSGCGAVSSINKKVKQKQPKFVKFVINNPPTMSGGTKAIGDKDKKKVAEAERLGRTKRDSPKSRPEGEEGNLGSEEEEEEDHEWSMDTSKDAVEKRTASFEEVANRIEERNKMAEEKTQAQEKEEEIESLSSMIEKKLSVDKVSTLLFESSKGLSAEDTTSMLFDALSEGSIVENVKTYLTLLQKTVSFCRFALNMICVKVSQC